MTSRAAQYYIAGHMRPMGRGLESPVVHHRSQTFYIAPSLVMALSAMGLNLGIFGILPTMHAKTNTKTNAFTIFARHVAFYACFIFMLRPQCIQSHMHLTNSYFDLEKNPEDPYFHTFSPMPG